MKSFRLNQWVVEPDRCRLVSGQEERTLQAREMELLERLAEASGEVVSKQELMRDVWRDRIVVDHVLPKTISGLRKSLGETAREPRIIETVPRRGYRLACPVVPIDGAMTTRDRRRFRVPRLLRVAAVCAWVVAPTLLGSRMDSDPAAGRVESVKSPIRVHIETGIESQVETSWLWDVEDGSGSESMDRKPVS